MKRNRFTIRLTTSVCINAMFLITMRVHLRKVFGVVPTWFARTVSVLYVLRKSRAQSRWHGWNDLLVWVICSQMVAQMSSQMNGSMPNMAKKCSIGVRRGVGRRRISLWLTSWKSAAVSVIFNPCKRSRDDYGKQQYVGLWAQEKESEKWIMVDLFSRSFFSSIFFLDFFSSLKLPDEKKKNDEGSQKKWERKNKK